MEVRKEWGPWGRDSLTLEPHHSWDPGIPSFQGAASCRVLRVKDDKWDIGATTQRPCQSWVVRGAQGTVGPLCSLSGDQCHERREMKGLGVRGPGPGRQAEPEGATRFWLQGPDPYWKARCPRETGVPAPLCVGSGLDLSTRCWGPPGQLGADPTSQRRPGLQERHEVRPEAGLRTREVRVKLRTQTQGAQPAWVTLGETEALDGGP